MNAVSAQLIAGVDEAGRGPLAGPVVAAAVILPPKLRIRGLRDSKLLTQQQREDFYQKIQDTCIAWAVAQAEVEEIEKINILQASLLAMQRALTTLPVKPDHVLVDGPYCPQWSGSIEAVIGGDDLYLSISAAAVMAKVTRDRYMVIMDGLYPGYGFARHKGYATPEHLTILAERGPTKIHRSTFMPVRESMRE